MELSSQMIMAAADTYFHYCHHQPYSLFHEESHRQRLQSNTVPKALLYAFVATAQRYWSIPQEEKARVVTSYATKAWSMVNLPWNGEDTDIFPTIQTILLLSVIDYTGKSRELQDSVDHLPSF
jgi:hypothetical protein